MLNHGELADIRRNNHQDSAVVSLVASHLTPFWDYSTSSNFLMTYYGLIFVAQSQDTLYLLNLELYSESWGKGWTTAFQVVQTGTASLLMSFFLPNSSSQLGGEHPRHSGQPVVKNTLYIGLECSGARISKGLDIPLAHYFWIQQRLINAIII